MTSVTSVTRVPETAASPADELTAEDAWTTLRRHGFWTVTRASFVRFRYADGFSHSRALALQLCLAVVPFLIAFVGLSGSLSAERPGMVLRRTLLSVVPGGSSGVLFLVLVAGADFAEAVEDVYGLDDDVVGWLALPVAVALMLASVTVMIRYGPRRRQPAWSLLAVGAAVSFVLWLAFTGLLAGYLQASGSFGAVYGPLTGIMALLIWAQLSSMAILLGFATAAQLEATAGGVPDPVEPDPERADPRSADVP